ncbi:hypothetical protein BAE44_0001403 [Dichanthelium oligosanthes]|uniref:Fe2OG dioxygenase domain-containing protein n=1 Tax=Dichanthelium oligosanthes TaxID=888268 RepID=A0A1E5WJP4_9POAL|nr:hypothetical protein BAE44_0001403 [Dichanthelium oligosanthes]
MVNVLQGLELHTGVFSPGRRPAADRRMRPPHAGQGPPRPPLRLPPSCVPDSCIVNIYDVDDCIPPHIDHHDFVRPFCTVSFLAECSILFGKDLRVLGPGEFAGSASISLPVGSVLVLKGNGADVAKHCVPAVPAKRISTITFRKMDHTKLPFNFRPDLDLHNLAAPCSSCSCS